MEDETQQNDGTVWSTRINAWVTPAQLEAIAGCERYSEQQQQDGRPAFVRIGEQAGTRGDLEFLVPGDYVWDGESEVWKHPDLLGFEVATLMRGLDVAIEPAAEAALPTAEAAPAPAAEPTPAPAVEEKPKRKRKKKEPEPVLSDRDEDYSITLDMINRQGLQNDPRITNRRCLLAVSLHSNLRAQPQKEFYWAKDYNGHTTREKAPIRTVMEVIRYLGSGDYVLEVLKDQRKEGVRSSIESFFTPNFLQLIQLSPENPIVRAQIMRQLLKEPPKDAKTYEQVKEWVETTFEDSFFTPAQVISRGSGSREQFTIPVTISRDEFGICNYTCRQHMTENIALDAETVEGWIAEGLSMSDILAKIREMAHDVEFNSEVEEDNRYSDHETSDTDNYSYTYRDVEAVRQSLHTFVSENCSEEALEALENS